MTRSTYITPDEYSSYGVCDTTADLVSRASSLIDQYLKRPEGLVFVPDSSGLPAYMAALTKTASYLTIAAMAPGQNVTVPVSGQAYQMVQPGDVLIVDRADPTKMEALAVYSVTPAGVAPNPITPQTITFSNVQFSHNSGAVLDAGLTITDQRRLPSNRPLTILSRWPIARAIGGSGRYGYTRRGSSQTDANMTDFNLLASLSKFGGPPLWEPFLTTQPYVDINPQSNQIWIPSGVLLAYYTEVRIRYVAGYTADAIPDAIKQACANLINGFPNQADLGAVKSYKAGGTAVERFADTMIDGDTKLLLKPWYIKGVA